MENIGSKENNNVKNTLNDFITSYKQRDTGQDFSSWLADKLREEMPEVTPEKAERLSGEIIGAIADYDNTLQDLKDAQKKGYSKEEWFAERLEKTYSEMPPNEAGAYLEKMDAEILANDMRLAQLSVENISEETIVEEVEPVEWNKYSLKAKAIDIGKQLANGALFAAAKALQNNIEGENVEIGAVVKDALGDGLTASTSEVKAVVAGAVRVAAEKGLEENLDPDTPVEVISDLAGAAVEGAEALYDAANGKISVTEAIDKAGMAGVAAGCCIGERFLRGFLSKLPFGPIIVDLLEGLLEHIKSTQFVEQVYTAVKGAAIATWEGIKKSKTVAALKKIGQGIKSLFA